LGNLGSAPNAGEDNLLDGVFRDLIKIEVYGRRDDRWVEVGGFVDF
jgi:hypothetical protein